MSTRRVKTSAFEQYRAVLDADDVPYEVMDNGAMIVVMSDGLQVVTARGWDAVTSVFIECNPLDVRSIKGATMAPPRQGVPHA